MVKDMKQILEEKGFVIEEQPKFKITHEDDEEFLMMVDDLNKFYADLD